MRKHIRMIDIALTWWVVGLGGIVYSANIPIEIPLSEISVLGFLKKPN
jgi:hypothetical protein